MAGRLAWSFGSVICGMALLLPAVPASPQSRPADPIIDARTALIVVDLQRSVLTRPMLEPVDAVVNKARGLADAFRRNGLPVVMVHSSTQPGGRTQQLHRKSGTVDPARSDLLPSLGMQRSDHIVSKWGWSAFSRTDLSSYLRRHHITQVVILGYSTSIGVESTARDAYDLGYNVTIVADATTDTDVDVHNIAMEKIFPRLGEVVSAEEITLQLSKH